MYADLVLLNGNVITLCEAKPFAEAIAIKGSRIMKVGRNIEISRCINEKTKVIDLNRKTVIPGLIDSHMHVSDFAKTLLWVNLQEATSIEDIKNMIKKRVEKTSAGKWIIGKGWDEGKLIEKKIPALSDIDEVSPENPVVLYRAKGKVCVVNSAALHLIDESVGLNNIMGDLELDPLTGKPNGVLRNSATDLVWKLIPETSTEELAELIRTACKEILKMGVTTVHWIASTVWELYALEKASEGWSFPLRIYLIIPVGALEIPYLLHKLKEIENEYFRVGGAMLSVDGYLANETAALTEPYKNSGKTGKLYYESREIERFIERAGRNGLQPVIHAMGDKAIKEALKAIENASKASKFRKLRIRLETAALFTPKLIEKVATLEKVIVSVQPYMGYSEVNVWKAMERIGPERVRWLYPLKTLIERGLILAGGTDAPMEPKNIFFHIKAAATWTSKERITVYEALKMYTLNAAYAMGAEEVKGSIEEGKLADLTVISENPLTLDPEKIDEVKVELTIVGGRIAYANENDI